MATSTADAVVIGAGPNGLVAANALVDAGWDVILLEATDSIGGAVRSAEVTAPGFTSDLFSAFYPLAAASPVIRDLQLPDYGLSWTEAPHPLAHALPDGRGVAIRGTAEDTAAGLDEFDPGTGDGAAWMQLCADWQRVRDPLLDALFTPFPPVQAAIELLRRSKVAGLADLARLAVLPVRRLGTERFRGSGAPLLLTGNAMHSDVPPDAAGSGAIGWLLTMLAQDVGFPVPRGGSGNLAVALGARFKARGGQIRLESGVERILTGAGRALGVRTVGGQFVRARRAVLADVPAPALYRDLVGLSHLPASMSTALDHFQWDNPTLKLNWALRGPVPWRAAVARGAGTVHVGVDLDGFVDFAADLSVGRLPRHPFLLFGQMTTADATRSPSGTESAWAYTHLPHAVVARPADLEVAEQRVEEHLEQVAPGFREAVIGRFTQRPADLQAANPSLVDGALNGGTSYPHQQLIFRPTPGLGRPDTPIAGLYLASASAHPGGGVHGACGWNAAVTALRASGRGGAVRQLLSRTAWDRLLPGEAVRPKMS